MPTIIFLKQRKQSMTSPKPLLDSEGPLFVEKQQNIQVLYNAKKKKKYLRATARMIDTREELMPFCSWSSSQQLCLKGVQAESLVPLQPRRIENWQFSC